MSIKAGKSFCITCKRKTNQIVLHEAEERNADDSGWRDETVWQIIKCGGCDTISFRKIYTDISYQGYEDEIFYDEELFPHRDADTIYGKDFKNIPPNLKVIHKETLSAYNNKQFLLCSGGIRAIIEGICNNKKIKSGQVPRSDGSTMNSSTLEGKIEGLYQKGHLTKDNAKILHKLRFIGNEALHELSTPNPKELSLAIDIVEHILENIYEIGSKASELKTSKTKRKK